MSSLTSWLVPGVLASVSTASTEILGVELTKVYAPGNQKQQEVTSNHITIGTGLIALLQVLRKHGIRGLNCFGTGCVPWYAVLLLSAWRCQWVIWIDRALQFAPNPGIAKAMINLNTVWAALIGVLFLRQGLTAKQAAGILLSFAGCGLIAA
jgi:drug/metabolite transporter (DMT)-like permease